MTFCRSVLQRSAILHWIEEQTCKFIEVHFILRNVVIGGHYLVGDGLLLVDDGVERAVDGGTAKQVVARNVVLLPDAVGTVFALAAVGISPWKLNESHVGKMP